MPVKLLQVLVPDVDVAEVREQLDKESILKAWDVSLPDEQVLTAVLMRSDQSQTAIDRLNEVYGERDGFRLMVQTVDATLPLPAEDDQDSNGDDNNKQKTTVSREELHARLDDESRITGAYIAAIILSTIVAAFGFVLDDVAVIIGAMVIAPLLAGNVALSLATTLADVKLGIKALRTNMLGVAIAFVLSLLIGAIVPFDAEASQILGRTNLSAAMVVVALAAGSAGTLAFTTGVPAALIGVMVAVALLPPLVASGMLFGAGNYSAGAHAFVLLATNVICVNLAGVLTFLLQGVRPRSYYEKERARQTTFAAIGLWTALLGALIALIWWLSDKQGDP